MVKIVHDELTALMGGDEAPLNTDGNPAVILMSGLQGAERPHSRASSPRSCAPHAASVHCW